MRLLTCIALAAAVASAEIVKPPFSPRQIQSYMSGTVNSAILLKSWPVMTKEGPTCDYLGSYHIKPTDRECPDRLFYHLAKIASAEDNPGLFCYYDRDMTAGTFLLSTTDPQSECPDVIIAESRAKFLAAVYFDDNDPEYMYYLGTKPVKLEIDVTDNDIEKYPRLKQQIQYRQKSPRSNRRQFSFN